MPVKVLGSASQQIAGVMGALASVPRRLRSLAKRRERATVVVQKPQAPSLEERREQLVEFYERYESLVDVLCSAARYGPDTALETQYAQLRGWMMRGYQQIRPFAVAYLLYDDSDASQSLALHGYGGDAFEALFAATTLEEFLRVDDGLMMSRIERTRDALILYGDHLRQLMGT